MTVAPPLADAVLDENASRFLRNLYRKNEPPRAPEPGMALMQLARAEGPLGEPVMSDVIESSVMITALIGITTDPNRKNRITALAPRVRAIAHGIVADWLAMKS